MTENVGTKTRNPEEPSLAFRPGHASAQDFEADTVIDATPHPAADAPLNAESGLDDWDQVHTIVDETAPDGWSYEVPRPWLSIEQAAFMLGRSARGVERSILGRWGNKLPEGWSARRVKIDGVEEWRIIPPPGFRIKHSRHDKPKENSVQDADVADVDASPLVFDPAEDDEQEHSKAAAQPKTQTSKKQHNQKKPQPVKSSDRDEESNMPPTAREADSGFSLEKLFQSAGKMAQKELASFGLAVRNDRHNDDVEHATIVIDRSDEVEKLLRELSETRKELADQRRMHLDDLRVMHEMQSSMRLLEVNARETAELKQDLGYAQKALLEHKKRYEEFVALPWWKKIFRKLP